jgi:hypothetical protein
MDIESNDSNVVKNNKNDSSKGSAKSPKRYRFKRKVPRFTKSISTSSTKRPMFTEIVPHIYFKTPDFESVDNVTIDVTSAMLIMYDNIFPNGSVKAGWSLEEALLAYSSICQAMLLNLIRGAHQGDAEPALVNIHYAGTLFIPKEYELQIKSVSIPKKVAVRRLSISIYQLINAIQATFIAYRASRTLSGTGVADIKKAIVNNKVKVEVLLHISQDLNYNLSDLIDSDNLTNQQVNMLLSNVMLIIAEVQDCYATIVSKAKDKTAYAEYVPNNRSIESVATVKREGGFFVFENWDNDLHMDKQWMHSVMETPVILQFHKTVRRSKFSSSDISPKSFGSLNYWGYETHLVHNEEDETIEEDPQSHKIVLPQAYLSVPVSKSVNKDFKNVVEVKLNPQPQRYAGAGNLPCISPTFAVEYCKGYDEAIFNSIANILILVNFSDGSVKAAFVHEKNYTSLATPKAVGSKYLAKVDSSSWEKIFIRDKLKFIFK